MSENRQRRVLIIAGPNGAGKTTFARTFLPQEADCPVFVNADLIAAGLSPFAPGAVAVRAGRLMLEEIARHASRRESFAFETTLSGQGYVRHIAAWRLAGYRVKLVYLSLPNVELAISRVAARVAQGGHDVPVAVIRRRFMSGLHQFNANYKSIVDTWTLYDNSGRDPLLLADGEM
ncbi:MAG: zeta toxin family protein [Burkholderiales bacterium]